MRGGGRRVSTVAAVGTMSGDTMSEGTVREGTVTMIEGLMNMVEDLA